MNKEFAFLLKVLRNAVILSGGFFVSVWAVGNLSWIICKPIIIFGLGYIFAELSRHYGIKTPMKKAGTTIIFN